MAQETTISITHRQRMFDKEVDVWGTFENPYFRASDIAKWLETKNTTSMVSKIDPDEVIKFNLGSLSGETLFLTEDGLYDVLMLSRKPIARQFKKGIKKMLHEIRTTGGYIATKQDDTEDDIMARALLIAENRVKALKDRNATLQAACDGYETQRIEANKRIEALASSNEQKAIEIKQLTPDADYTREVMTSTSTWNTNVIAKEFGMSAKSLNQHLKNLGLQYKQHNVWMLTERYQNKGYTKTTTFKYVQSDGTVGTRLQMEWTEKGRRWLHELHKQGKF